MEKFHDLRLSMRQARIPMSFEMYISNAMFYSVVAGLLGALFGLIMAYVLYLLSDFGAYYPYDFFS